MDNSNERPLGWTTLEESEQLIKAGLSIETADMCYPHFIRGGADSYDANPVPCSSLDYPYEMPCWSLGALINLLPKVIEPVGEHFIDLMIGYPHCFGGREGENLWISYFDWTGLQHGPFFERTTFIEAVIEMIIWLVENNYIK